MVVDKYAISEMATFVMGKTSLFPLYLNVTMIDGILNRFLTDMDTGFHMIQFIIIYSTPWILSAIFLHVYRCIHVGYIHPDVWYSKYNHKTGPQKQKTQDETHNRSTRPRLFKIFTKENLIMLGRYAISLALMIGIFTGFLGCMQHISGLSDIYYFACRGEQSLFWLYQAVI